MVALFKRYSQYFDGNKTKAVAKLEKRKTLRENMIISPLVLRHNTETSESGSLYNLQESQIDIQLETTKNNHFVFADLSINKENK